MKVSVITVNYNGFAVTCELIDSLYQSNYQSCEIIVVDNGSKVDEASLLRNRFPAIKVIRSCENLGFAGGNNLGIRYASGDFFLFLNNDTTVTDGFLEAMLNRIMASPCIGVVCPKILFEFAPDRIQFAGYTPLHNITLRNKLIGFNEIDRGQYDLSTETPYALGAAMLIKREVVEKVGGIPEGYFLYYEELDWCLRIRRAGFTIWYEYGAKIFHKESASVGRLGPLKQYYLTRNRLLFARRNLGKLSFLLSVLFQLFLSLPKNTLEFIVNGRFDLLLATWKGVLNGFNLILNYDSRSA